ncbi:hypothetical protein BR10RB9215_C20829 [Brucella sp. 10RB9215]|uniref:glycosyltransferase family 2 protein n=1 Tax=Brucella sp. 10RB9215 TaxID=1149953 RepID=UPI00090C832A|nr:glycosyltransferase family 2 protein [Brucella sp. 10RB9215]SBW16159.1 hypothetical protein BR10RB9215_C20829 [Brucella sp. 10RB9215]
MTLRPQDVDVVVALPTFLRLQYLLHALESVNAQRTGLRFEAVVVENKMAHFGYEHEQYRNTQKN